MGPQPLRAMIRIEKPGDIGQFVRRPVSRQRLQKNFTIGHALEAGIQQRKHATIRLRSNQPAKSLPQFYHRFGQLIIPEGIATGRADRFQAGF